MKNNLQFLKSTSPQQQKSDLLFFYLAKTKSNSLIAYCIKHALEKNDQEGVLTMLKSLRDEDGGIIVTIYGEAVMQLVNTL